MPNKQAVVLIHGIGEQVPMETLRGFVQAVWATDNSAHNPHLPQPNAMWSKPDHMSGDFELRRLTTPENREGQRTDFFEFYWAHLMQGTEVAHLLAWARILLLRSPSRVPKQLRGLWFFLVCMTLAVVAGLILMLVFAHAIPGWIRTALSVSGTAAWALFGAFVIKKVAGDAARYLHVAPENIESRRHIREAGVKLLQTLHRSGEFNRIIVVGHSLGSVIGYDILTHYWARVHTRFGKSAEPATDKLEQLEALARDPNRDGFVDKNQAAQSEYLDELRAAQHPWLVTDFVTMGSPLAHAALLLAGDEEQWRQRQQEREFPTCPPVLEEITVAPRQKQRKFSFELGDQWTPHHAAVFAPTRWTNLYFPCRATVFGDVIGGPVAPVFGPGVRDVAVTTDLQCGLFTHTLYWKLPAGKRAGAPVWISELRRALRLCLTPPTSLREGSETRHRDDAGSRAELVT